MERRGRVCRRREKAIHSGRRRPPPVRRAAVFRAADPPDGGKAGFRVDTGRVGTHKTPHTTRPARRCGRTMRGGGVSRAAKGADCKSAGYAFVGSSPTSPTNLIFQIKNRMARRGCTRNFGRFRAIAG
ncbi:hypothetical protein A33M_1031 [Rhodovulum sp. PH10]|nr:hypothetical protein A33M_1031 [Rhodovulum sp. PH10]